MSALKEDKSESIAIFLEPFKCFTSEEIRDAYAYRNLIFMNDEVRNMDPMNKEFRKNFIGKHRLKLEVFLGEINQLRHNMFQKYFENKCHKYAPQVLVGMFEIAFMGSMGNYRSYDSEKKPD